MYSLNVSVPSSVGTRATALGRELPRARTRGRDEHSLCVKRFETASAAEFEFVRTRCHEVLADVQPFEITVTELDYFAQATNGSSPVVYLAVESPALDELHRRLVDVFGPIQDLEGDEYVPHVTVARGGELDRARALTERKMEPIRFPVSSLTFWDARRNRQMGEVALGPR